MICGNFKNLPLQWNPGEEPAISVHIFLWSHRSWSRDHIAHDCVRSSRMRSSVHSSQPDSAGKPQRYQPEHLSANQLLARSHVTIHCAHVLVLRAHVLVTWFRTLYLSPWKGSLQQFSCHTNNYCSSYYPVELMEVLTAFLQVLLLRMFPFTNLPHSPSPSTRIITSDTKYQRNSPRIL